jgi:hypothetical protein
MACDNAISRVEIGLYPWAQWAECVESFGTCPLAVSPLQVACGNIIANGISQNEFQSIVWRDPTAFFTDDGNQFGFVFDLV